MKVPEYIRYKMHRAANLHAEAARLMSHVDQWFERRGYSPEELRCGDGCSLEELDYGYDVTNAFCDRIERGEFERSDNEVYGRWIWNEECECWVCSNCELSALNNYRGNSTDSNYCPNCGARMDGDEEHDPVVDEIMQEEDRAREREMQSMWL